MAPLNYVSYFPGDNVFPNSDTVPGTYVYPSTPSKRRYYIRRTGRGIRRYVR